MTKKILLAGLLGGLGLFVWGFMSHMVLGLGQVGIKEMPYEQPVVDAMKAGLPKPGLYFFPGMGLGDHPTRDQQKAAMPQYAEKYKAGPVGILVYSPTGTTMMSPGQLLTELGLNIVEALIAAWLLSLATGLVSFGSRVGFVLVLGMLSAIVTNIQYWNWYGFPADFTGAAIFSQVVGFLFVGLIVAAFVKAPVARPVSVPSRAA